MTSEARLCIVCGVKKASPHRLKCGSCKNLHLKDVQRTCTDCQERLAAPGRKICWNCKILRNLAKHPENREKANERRNHRYKTNTNGFRTKRLQVAAVYRKQPGYREKACEVSREWREENPERHANNNLKWRLQNVEHVAEYKRTYAVLYPERVRHGSKLRKARLKQAKIGIFTPELWQERIELFGHCCAYCLQPLDIVTLDHMTPITRGGLHDIDNAVSACGSCNASKSNRNLLEWVLYKRGIRIKGIGNPRPTHGRPRKTPGPGNP